MNDIQYYQEPAKELASNTKINIKLEGWPAAATCSVGILSLAAVSVVAILHRN